MKTPTTAGKAKALVIVLIIIILVILYFVLVPSQKAEAPIGNATTTVAVMSVEKNPTKGETANYTTDIETPVVSGLTDVKVQKSVNDQLAAKVNFIVTDFKDQATAATPSGPDTKSSLTIKLTTFEKVKDTVLATNLQVSTYFTGAAHPITVSETSNFDLSTGKELELIDIFDSGVAHYKVISDYTTKALKEKLAAAQGVSVTSKDLQYFAEGSDSNPENFSTFIVRGNGIEFLFGQYQVAPYVMGEQSVLVPWSVIKEYMKKNALTDALTS